MEEKVEEGFSVPRSQHKPGCLGDKPGWMHRVPIDCITRAELEGLIAKLKSELEAQKNTIRDLKAALYDLEHDEERR